MKQLKLIKNKLKEKNEWKAYKAKFDHRQMKLVVTKIALVFDTQLDWNKFYEIEKKLISAPKGEEMYEEAFKNFANEISYKSDWKSLGKFMWYQYQTSTYYKDIKKDKANVFTKTNTVKINEIKRDHYLKWLHTVDRTDDKFNDKIIQVIKLVF